MNRLFQRLFLFAIVLGLMTAGTLTAADGGKEKSKSYSLNLTSGIKAGKVMLKAGQYKFKMDGANAIFTRQENDETFTIPATIETGKAKFDKTTFVQSSEGGEPHIVSIDLKGSTNTMKFN
jgi:hypothetical protein